MTGKKMYSLHKGKEATTEEGIWPGISKGIICGYDNDESLIMAVTEGEGWISVEIDDKIKTHKNNPLGYLYVGVENIVN